MWAMAKPESEVSMNFHRAKTDPERALDAILSRDKDDVNVFEYLTRHTPGIKTTDYANMFTAAYKQAVTDMEAQQVQENCGGKYIQGELCGIDFSPVTCAQDVTDTFYLYRTEQISKREAIIAYAWPKSLHASATYRLLKKNGRWKLDGVMCAGGAKFNME